MMKSVKEALNQINVQVIAPSGCTKYLQAPDISWNKLFKDGKWCTRIQLFRERLSKKVHTPILKGIVGGFEFTVLQRNLKEWHERPLKYVCEF